MGTKINNTNLDITSLLKYAELGHLDSIFRNLIMDKYKNKCQICGIESEFNHVHHIKKRQDYPELEYVEDNVILLCPKHHQEQHKKIEVDNLKEFKKMISLDTIELLEQCRILTGKSWNEFFLYLIRMFKKDKFNNHDEDCD